MAITTDTVALRLAQRLVAHGVEIDDVEAFAADFAPDLVDWVGGEEAVPVALASKVTSTATAWNTDVMQRLDWWTGPADGGPNGDGLYPMTNAAGVVTMFPSLAKMLDSTAKGNPGWSPRPVIEADGATRAVLRIADWVGGEGAKPATGYVGAGGVLVGSAAAATDVFGGVSAALGALKTGAETAKFGAEAARDLAVSSASRVTQEMAPGADRLTVTDPSGNILVEISAALVNHPDINSMRSNASAGAAVAARVVPTTGLADSFVITDPTGNLLLEVSPSKINHPDVNALRTGVTTAQTQAAAAVSAASRVVPSDGLADGFVVTDAAANILMRVTGTTIDHPVIATILASLAQFPTGMIAADTGAPEGLVITDSNGWKLLEVSKTGIGHPKITALDGQITSLRTDVDAVAAGLSDRWAKLKLLGEICHIIVDGQSLSRGQAASPVISTTPSSVAYRFNGGARADDGGSNSAANHGSLVPLIETSYSQLHETPSSGCVEMLVQLLSSEDGIDLPALGQKLLLSNPGQSGVNIAQLSPGGTYWTRLQDDITYGKACADALGKSYAVGATCWIQGESDYSIATSQSAYVALSLTLIAAIRAQAAAVTGIDRQIPFLTYQVATHFHGGQSIPAVALAQLQLAQTQDGVALALPTYFLTFAADGVHVVNTSSKWMGAYFGLAIKRWLFDGKKPTPLAPSLIQRLDSKTLAVRYLVAAGKQLVWDTTTAPAMSNYGFDIVDSTGAALTISSVTLVGRDVVQFKTSTAIPAGARLRYAWRGDSHRGIGNLRDNAGDTLKFQPAGLNLPMHTWAPIIDMEIP